MRLHQLLILLASSTIMLDALDADAAEICGNGVDDDGDGIADEGCYPTLTTGQCESPLSCAETGMVSPTTGSLRYALDPDIAPRAPWGPGIGFRRVYLSQFAPGGGSPAYRTSLGPRWGHTYATWIDSLSSPTRAVLHTAQGQDVLLNKTSSDATWDYFTPTPGHHYKEFKRRLAAPNEYEITTLTGESMMYDGTGRLKQVRDGLAIPNVVNLEYDGNAQVSRVIDASGKRQLLFAYASGVMTSMKFQIYLSGVWTDQHTTTFGYTSGNLTSVTIGGQLAQTNVYTASYLTSILDGSSKTLVNFVYDGTTAGKVVRVDTPRGVVGYEVAPSRTQCTGAAKTALYFHKANTTSCTTDADCGTGNLCGGKTGAGATGQCFRGARCLTIASPSEDVITSVSAFAGNSQPCDGACLEAIDHVWKTVGSVLDLGAVQDPSGNYTTKEFDGNGMPTRIVYGDPDSTAGGGTREVFLYYGDANVPGKVTEVRRKSDLDGRACSTMSTIGCARTLHSYNSDHLLGSTQRVGTTLDSVGNNLGFTYATGYTYNAKGQLTQIDGPLATADDITLFEYWSAPTDPIKDGFLQNYKRKKDATTFLTQSSLTYDFWGNSTSISDVDGTISCQTFSSARGFLTQRREQMAGQTNCTATSADLVTDYARDSALRLTQLTRPDGSCLISEYDARGRLSKVKRRDDCNAASTGDTQELTYSDEGLLILTELKDAAGTVKKRQELTYFDSRRLEKMINPVNTAKWTTLAWDPRGLLESVTALDGAANLGKTQWTFNAEGRVTAERRYTAGFSAFDSWSVLFGWLGDQSQVTDGDTKVIGSTRDDLGRLVKLSGNDYVTQSSNFPTLRVYDAASRLVSVAEGVGNVYGTTHTFTFDHLARALDADYAGTCNSVNVPDIVRVYDGLTGAPACPAGTSCTNLGGRLAYVKVKLMCTTAAGPDGDYTLEQETWYGYDPAGRLTHEYISDDNGRTAAHVYAWTKNGALQQTTLPSATVLGATYDSAGGSGTNSNKDRITALWRTSTGTPIINNITYEPFGSVNQYDQRNSAGTGFLRTRIGRNLAYRQTLNIVEKTDGTSPQSSVTIGEDYKGRTISRDYSPSDPAIAGRYDSFYTYDLQDRVACEATTSGACPTSGTTLKNNHNTLFKAAGDWKSLLRPIPGSTGVTHTFGLYTTFLGVNTHFISTVDQTGGSPALGTTMIDRNADGSRYRDFNNSVLTNDLRAYTYDERNNLTNVRGQYKVGASWNYYDVASAFDARNRRVFKSFYNETTLKTATWFFYYDALDRLTEVRYTPDTSVAATYSVFQLVWLGDKLVAYWQTDYPTVTTSKRYVSTDEMNRPIDMMSWPASGAATRVWTINPDAWGNDTVVVGAGVFQPIVFAGQFRDDETVAWMNDGSTRHRPAVILNGHRTYDPWIGAYLQLDPLADSTWSSYVYANSDPVGNQDPSGLMDDDPNGWCWVCSSVEGCDYNQTAPQSCFGGLTEPPGVPGSTGGNTGYGGSNGGGGGGGGNGDVTTSPPKCGSHWWECLGEIQHALPAAIRSSPDCQALLAEKEDVCFASPNSCARSRQGDQLVECIEVVGDQLVPIDTPLGSSVMRRSLCERLGGQTLQCGSCGILRDKIDSECPCETPWADLGGYECRK